MGKGLSLGEIVGRLATDSVVENVLKENGEKRGRVGVSLGGGERVRSTSLRICSKNRQTGSVSRKGITK